MKLISNLTLLLAAFFCLSKESIAAELRGTNRDNRSLQDDGMLTAAPHEHAEQTAQVGSTLQLSRPASNGQVRQDTLDNQTPHLAVNYIIALKGAFPERSGGTQASGPMMGEIRMFGGNFPPAGWAFCEGQLISINSNPALFSILGTIYGGDGRTTFGLPDLRGRAPVHQDSQHRLGYFGGTSEHVLSNENLPTTSQYNIDSIAQS